MRRWSRWFTFTLPLLPLLTSAAPVDKKCRGSSDIPQFVYDYAPVVYLHSQDPYLPSDLATHLSHTRPEVSFHDISGVPSPLTLDNLGDLNDLGGAQVWLTSKDDISTLPNWLKGVAPNAQGKTEGATSTVIVVTDHGDGTVDAFYMYFYSYNQGGKAFWQEVDNHVGDWEHNMIRFVDGVPQAVWYSQHGNGEAFRYSVVEKHSDGRRPVSYSAIGSHANYAITGAHDHVIPDINLPHGLLEDHTDRGKFWDPTLNAFVYTFDVYTGSFSPGPGSNPMGLITFVGRWGDDEYPDSDPRQQKIFGIELTAKYKGGPTGPEDKQLNRQEVCPANGIPCIVRYFLGP